MNKDVILEGEKMKQVALSTLDDPLKLLYFQFLAEITQIFACETSFHAEALGFALLFAKLFYQGGWKRKATDVVTSDSFSSLPDLERA